jgi:hypothetical protein
MKYRGTATPITAVRDMPRGFTSSIAAHSSCTVTLSRGAISHRSNRVSIGSKAGAVRGQANVEAQERGEVADGDKRRFPVLRAALHQAAAKGSELASYSAAGSFGAAASASSCAQHIWDCAR